MRKRATKSVLCTVGIVVLALGGVRLHGSAFDMDLHRAITREALDFLKPAILDDIVDDSDWPDRAGWGSAWHCDNCVFIETIGAINEWYDGTLAKLDPKSFDPFAATDWFGQLLHPAQDLYAHSNWVETMTALGKADLLFDRGIGRKWVVSGRWKGHPPGVVIAQGELKTLPENWTATLDKEKRLVTVTKADKTTTYGIISGTFGLADDCYDEIAMSHAELNKDRVGSDHPAYRLAVAQTRHEWCRLESLVFLLYGKEGLEKLRQAFISPERKSPCGEFCHLRIWARDTAGKELTGVKVKLELGDGWRFAVHTAFGPDVVRLNQEVRAEAEPAFQGLRFVEWKLAERRPFGKEYFLWWLPGSSANPWTFRVEKCDLVLIAIYGPAVEEKVPGESETPPPGEIEPPPGG